MNCGGLRQVVDKDDLDAIAFSHVNGRARDGSVKRPRLRNDSGRDFPWHDLGVQAIGLYLRRGSWRERRQQIEICLCLRFDARAK